MKKMHFILLAVLALIMVGLVSMWFIRLQDKMAVFPTTLDSTWHGPSIYVDNTTKGEERELIIYGQELIVHTSRYLGPKGSVAKITNGMNCQNCHTYREVPKLGVIITRQFFQPTRNIGTEVGKTKLFIKESLIAWKEV